MAHLHGHATVLTKLITNNGTSQIKNISKHNDEICPGIQACSFGSEQLSHGLKQVRARLGFKREGGLGGCDGGRAGTCHRDSGMRGLVWTPVTSLIKEYL